MANPPEFEPDEGWEMPPELGRSESAPVTERSSGGFFSGLKLLLSLVAVAWVAEIVDFFILGSLDQLGIRPRRLFGLLGVPLSPFLHSGFGHLISNTLPFLVLGALVHISGRRVFIESSLAILLLGGGTLWILGNGQAVYIGASLLIFGYFGFVVARGWMEKSWKSLVLSMATLIFYGGMIFGVLPFGQAENVSWFGHLVGLIAGIMAARLEWARTHPRAVA